MASSPLSTTACRRLVLGAALFAAAATIAACNSDGLVSGVPARSDVLWSVRTNTRAVTMAVGDTFRLAATPLSYEGDSIPDVVTTFRSGDEKKVLVDADGLMEAKGEVSIWSPVPVYIRLNSPRDSLTIEDTVLVVVTTTSQEVDVFTMQPLPGDSTIQAAGIPGRDVSVRAYDPDGNPLTELNVAYWTSDKRVAVNYGSYFQGIDTGTVTVYAQATAYGRTFIDSVQFRVTFPITGYFNIYPRYYLFPESDPVLSGPRLRIARGGVVTWQSQSPFPVDIVFDDPATALDPDGDGEETGGNIPVVASDPYTSAQRKFAEPGEYKFHSTAYPGIQGVVEVVP